MAEGLPPRDSDIWLDWVHFLRAYKVVIERVSQDLSEKQLPTLIEYSVLFWLNNADGNRLRLVDLSKGVLVSKPFVRDAPVYQWFAVPALVCLALGMALRAIPFFIDQT